MFISTGNKRGSKVIVEKYINGVLEGGYPKTYNAILSFPGYNSITLNQLAELSPSAYQSRMDDFEIYVQGEESGASFSNDLQAGYERVIADEGTCPIFFGPEITDFDVATNTLTWILPNGDSSQGTWTVGYSLAFGSNWRNSTAGASPRVNVMRSGTYNQDVYFRVKQLANDADYYSHIFIKYVGTIS